MQLLHKTTSWWRLCVSLVVWMRPQQLITVLCPLSQMLRRTNKGKRKKVNTVTMFTLVCKLKRFFRPFFVTLFTALLSGAVVL